MIKVVWYINQQKKLVVYSVTRQKNNVGICVALLNQKTCVGLVMNIIKVKCVFSRYKIIRFQI